MTIEEAIEMSKPGILKLANEYRSIFPQCVSVEDLIQIGNLAVVEIYRGYVKGKYNSLDVVNISARRRMVDEIRKMAPFRRKRDNSYENFRFFSLNKPALDRNNEQIFDVDQVEDKNYFKEIEKIHTNYIIQKIRSILDSKLTKTEKNTFDYIIDGKEDRKIAISENISINTFHKRHSLLAKKAQKELKRMRFCQRNTGSQT